MAWIELADQMIQREGGFPDLEQQFATLAATFDGALAVDRWTVGLVPAAAALELSGSDLQRSSNPYTLPGSARRKLHGSDLFDSLLAFLLGLTLHRRLEVLNALADPLSDFGNLLATEQNHEDDCDHQQLGPTNGFEHLFPPAL